MNKRILIIAKEKHDRRNYLIERIFARVLKNSIQSDVYEGFAVIAYEDKNDIADTIAEIFEQEGLDIPEKSYYNRKCDVLMVDNILTVLKETRDFEVYEVLEYSKSNPHRFGNVSSDKYINELITIDDIIKNIPVRFNIRKDKLVLRSNYQTEEILLPIELKITRTINAVIEINGIEDFARLFSTITFIQAFMNHFLNSITIYLPYDDDIRATLTGIFQERIKFDSDKKHLIAKVYDSDAPEEDKWSCMTMERDLF